MTAAHTQDELRRLFADGAVLRARFPEPKPPVDYSDLQSVSKAAKIAGIHPSSLWRKIRRGQIRTYGTRGMTRVLLSQLLPETTRAVPVGSERTRGTVPRGARQVEKPETPPLGTRRGRKEGTS